MHLRHHNVSIVYYAITKNTMSFSLIITFFTVMKVDEFHNILAAKAAYLFL